MKKSVSFLLVVAMCFTLSLNAFAAGTIATPIGGTEKIIFDSDDPETDSGMATIKITTLPGYEVDTVFEGREILDAQNGAYRREVYPDSDITVLYRPAGTGLPYAITDVASNSWYYNYVRFCVRNGIIKGMSETKFAPSETLTRAMFVTVLFRMCGEKKAQAALPADVPSNTWYSEAVRWAISTGITKAGSGGLFYPNRAVTREETAVMLYRAMGCTGTMPGYEPMDGVSQWAKTEVSLMAFIGIISSERPQESISRAEAAAVFARCMTTYDFWETNYSDEYAEKA